MTWFGNEIKYKDEATDAFGRLPVASPVTLFDSQQEYGLDTLRIWDATANGTLAAGSSNGSVSSAGNAVGPRDSNTRMVPITSSSTNGHYSVLQSRQYPRYIPGKGHDLLITGVFAAGSGSTASIVRRTSTSGSVVNNSVSQASWNIDPLDGTGKSGITIDFTKTQIMIIDAQWLGVGRVRVGFDIDGCIKWAHEFRNANSLTVPYTQTFNLPVRIEHRTTGASTSVGRFGLFDSANGIYLETSRNVAGGTVYFVCCSVQSSGGSEERGFPFSVGNGTTSISVTTRRPILSIRPKTTFNGLTNRAHIELAEMSIITKTNDIFYEIVVGGTLTGASFTSVNTDSVTEYDVSATAISGGISLISDYALAGSGSTKGISSNVIDTRSTLVLSQIDALTATQTPYTIVATSLSGTATVSSVFNWHEQTV